MNIKSISAIKSYRIERYSDLEAGEILRHVPILENGTQDPFRTEFFLGSTMLQTNRGPVTINFELKAVNLKDAFAVWGEALADKLREIEDQQVRAKILNGAGLNPSAVKKQ